MGMSLVPRLSKGRIMTTTTHLHASDTWSAPSKMRRLDVAVKTLFDGVHGYRTAADEVSSERLARVLRDCASSRLAAVNHLTEVAVHELSVVPTEETGTLRGALHRGWIRVKGAVRDESAVIETARRGETEAISVLQGVLEEDLNPRVEEAVRRALLDVERALGELEELPT
jgi:uncharacterized protein (TIGR02284 family)